MDTLPLFSARTAEQEFADLCTKVQQCRQCPRMSQSKRVLNRASGAIDADVMFVGEAPGRLGADSSGIPFHGDRSGHNFENLIEQVSLNRYSIFVTNSVLCNPKDSKGNNTPPNRHEINNCSAFLKEQIDLINPELVVTLGGTALHAVSLIEPHQLSLSDHVRTAHKWYRRTLIPAYHPGQRAMIHRSFANQLADYQFIAEKVRRSGKKARKISGNLNTNVHTVVDLITQHKQSISYFGLHKLFYLVELSAIRRIGMRLTGAYIVRQKDGPYCTDLHIKKLKKAFPSLSTTNCNGHLILNRFDAGLFSETIVDEFHDWETVNDIVRAVVEKYGRDDDASLKRRVYLTAPMRAILRSERRDGLNLFNAPIDFSPALRN